MSQIPAFILMMLITTVVCTDDSSLWLQKRRGFSRSAIPPAPALAQSTEVDTPSEVRADQQDMENVPNDSKTWKFAASKLLMRLISKTKKNQSGHKSRAVIKIRRPNPQWTSRRTGGVGNRKTENESEEVNGGN